MATDIFASANLAGIRLNNRILRSATDETEADDKGFPTEKLTKRYIALAKGEIGGIITGFMGVSEKGKAQQPGMLLIDNDEKIPAFSKMVAAVHDAGAPVIAQIAHCGSNGAYGKEFKVDKITAKQLEEISRQFIDAVIRAKKSGFDGVQLHFAHGYFLSQMISPATNHRRDDWGGSEEKRFHIADVIIKGIREQLPDYPVLVKINGEDDDKNGIHPREAVRISQRLEAVGVNAVEVSRGISFMKHMGPMYGHFPAEMSLAWYPGVKELPGFVKSMMKPGMPKMMGSIDPAPRKYNVDVAKKIKSAVHIPVIAVGGIHDLEEIESTINVDGIDFVSMSRPLILEPSLIQKYKQGRQTTAKCMECNHCGIGISQGRLQCWYGKIPSEINR